MEVLGNRILVRITKENRESIYSKTIKRDDGTFVKLWKTVPATDEIDSRISSLVVQTGIVEAVSKKINWIKVGDTALLNYDVCNSIEQFMYKDGDDDIYCLQAITTYHEDDEIAYRNRRTKRDQRVHSKGDIDYLSSLLGIVRGEILIANDPYIFFESESNIISKVSASGILYEEKYTIYTRTIIAASEKSKNRYGIKKGDEVMINDADSFRIKLDGEHTIDCMNDEDVLALIR